MGKGGHSPWTPRVSRTLRGGEFWAVTNRTFKSLQGLRDSHMDHENSGGFGGDRDNVVTAKPPP